MVKIFRTRKPIIKILSFSELQELKVRIRVQPNFPIIILILLTAFHKFAVSREPYTSARSVETFFPCHSMFGHETGVSWVLLVFGGSG